MSVLYSSAEACFYSLCGSSPLLAKRVRSVIMFETDQVQDCSLFPNPCSLLLREELRNARLHVNAFNRAAKQAGY